MNDLSNKELTERLKKNDITAFKILYQKFHAAIYTNSFKLVRDTVVAEDIVQEVFISLWENRKKLDSTQEIAGWLFVVSHNKSASYLKRNLLSLLAQKKMILPVADTPYAGEAVVNAQVEVLKKAIEQLSPQKRKVFELCKLQRRTYEQVAIELKLSKHTVKEYLTGSVGSIKKYVKLHANHSTLFICALSCQNFLNYF